MTVNGLEDAVGLVVAEAATGAKGAGVLEQATATIRATNVKRAKSRLMLVLRRPV